MTLAKMRDASYIRCSKRLQMTRDYLAEQTDIEPKYRQTVENYLRKFEEKIQFARREAEYAARIFPAKAWYWLALP